MSRRGLNCDSKPDTTLLGKADSKMDRALVVVASVVAEVSAMMSFTNVDLVRSCPDGTPAPDAATPSARNKAKDV